MDLDKIVFNKQKQLPFKQLILLVRRVLHCVILNHRPNKKQRNNNNKIIVLSQHVPFIFREQQQ